jgi:hypothetical protein
MTKQDIQNALLNEYMKRDQTRAQVEESDRQITALRNMLSGMHVAEAEAPPKDVTSMSPVTPLKSVPRAERPIPVDASGPEPAGD